MSDTNNESETVGQSTPEKLVAAINSGDLDTVRNLLGRGADPNAVAHLYDETPFGLMQGPSYAPIILSARKGRTDILETLLDAGADVNLTTKYGITPLIRAAKDGKLDAAKLLVARGARLDVKDADGLSPERAAKEFGHHEVVAYLRSLAPGTKKKAKAPAEPPRYGVESFDGHSLLILARAEPKATAEALASASGASSVQAVAWGAKVVGDRPLLGVVGLAGRPWSVVFGFTKTALEEPRLVELAEKLSARLRARVIAYGHSDTADALLLRVFNDGTVERSFYEADGGFLPEWTVAVDAGTANAAALANAILTELEAFVPAIPVPARPLGKMGVASLKKSDVSEAFTLFE
jgi:hypothetical protein